MTLTLGELRTRLRRLLSESEAGFWADAELNDYLNDSAKEIVRRTGILIDRKKTALIGGEYKYPCPSDMCRPIKLEQYHGSRFWFIPYVSFSEFMDGFHPGTTGNILEAWTIGEQEGDLIAVGTADAESATELTDNDADFVNAGVEVGDRVFNVTDDSWGEITNVQATKVTVSGLTGGADNKFEIGDNYEIQSRFKRCPQIFIRPTPSTSDPTGTETLYLTYVRWPRVMASDSDYCELPDTALQALLYWAWALAKIKDQELDWLEAEATMERLCAQIIGQENRIYREFHQMAMWSGVKEKGKSYYAGGGVVI